MPQASCGNEQIKIIDKLADPSQRATQPTECSRRFFVYVENRHAYQEGVYSTTSFFWIRALVDAFIQLGDGDNGHRHPSLFNSRKAANRRFDAFEMVDNHVCVCQIRRS